MKQLRCKCGKKRKLTFEKVFFDDGKPWYRGTCKRCGLVWRYYDAKNYKVIATSSNLKEVMQK